MFELALFLKNTCWWCEPLGYWYDYEALIVG